MEYYHDKKTIPSEDIDNILVVVFDDYLKANENESFIYPSFISLMTKLHFEKIDKRIEKFGEKWGNYVKSASKLNDLDDLDFSAFCDLLLNNVSFFNQKVFPNVDLQGIENQLQVAALLEGKYFRYLSTNNFYRDLNFKFE
jgi:hypothetical protein